MTPGEPRLYVSPGKSGELDFRVRGPDRVYVTGAALAGSRRPRVHADVARSAPDSRLRAGRREDVRGGALLRAGDNSGSFIVRLGRGVERLWYPAGVMSGCVSAWMIF